VKSQWMGSGSEMLREDTPWTYSPPPSRIGSGVWNSASFPKKILRLVGRLGSEPLLVGRL